MAQYKTSLFVCTYLPLIKQIPHLQAKFRLHPYKIPINN